MLRWFKDATALPTLARDARVSIATAYRYVHEAIDVIAAQAPELSEVLAAGREQGWEFGCLDGTLIPSVRSAAPSATGHDVWFSGKHHRHGGRACPESRGTSVAIRGEHYAAAPTVSSAGCGLG